MTTLRVVPTGTKRRRYTKRQKAEAVGAAESSGIMRASEQTGIPPTTIEYWRQQPAFAELRSQNREEVAADVWGAFQVGVRRVVELIPTTEDMAKVAIAAGILYDKYALMSGMATARTETKAITDGLDDHEKAAIRKLLDEALAEPV